MLCWYRHLDTVVRLQCVLRMADAPFTFSEHTQAQAHMVCILPTHKHAHTHLLSDPPAAALKKKKQEAGAAAGGGGAGAAGGSASGAAEGGDGASSSGQNMVGGCPCVGVGVFPCVCVVVLQLAMVWRQGRGRHDGV